MFKALDLWLPAYLCRRRSPRPRDTVDLLLAVCDHFEPRHGADTATALERIRRWHALWPALIAPFRDADGVPPRHTFFYPVEQYEPALLSALAGVCSASGAEVEVHLHHDGDSAPNLRARLHRGIAELGRHGLLTRDASGNPRYGFIHGNWALDHSHPHGRHCGVPEDLDVLLETGCYADFTMPSAPDPTQTRTINSLYYAQEDGRPKSHDSGRAARVRDGAQSPPPAGLLCVQGPLALNWQRRKWGLLPRLENGALTAANPPRPDRMRLWVQVHIHVAGQPNWLFIKLHTHGGVPENMRTLLGEPMRRFWEHALATYNDGRRFRLHFVTAREMVNILHAAEDGHTGNPGRFRNYRFPPPPLGSEHSEALPGAPP